MSDGEEMEIEPNVAQSYTVPGVRIVSVEHPCIVKNFERGFKSLGGEQHLKHVIEHRVGDGQKKITKAQKVMIEPVAGVSLRPNDILAKRLPSKGIDTRNILIRVTLPKRTGRKRKRGSDEPFLAPDGSEPKSDSIQAPELLQRLRDNEGQYSIETVGMIRETHRFRSLPDYQFCADEVPIMRELRDHAIIPSYERLSRFRVDTQPGTSDLISFPVAPIVARNDQPYRYRYTQEPSVVYTFDENGQPVAENNSRTQRRPQHWTVVDAAEVPQAPPLELQQQPIENGAVMHCIEDLRKILETRPIVTRRVLQNLLPNYSEENIKAATQWVGYMFHAGPWREALIKFGVDPRSDPKYRMYQTVTFKVERDMLKGADQTQQWSRTTRYHSEAQAHIFDGVNTTNNGKLWQFCDITEPLLREKLDSMEIRPECELLQWGWFHAGSLSKVRIIMRDMLKHLFDSRKLPMDDYKTLLDLPEVHAERNRDYNIDRAANKHTNEMVVAWGNMSKAGAAGKSKRRRRSNVAGTLDGAGDDAGVDDDGSMAEGDDGGNGEDEREDEEGDDGIENENEDERDVDDRADDEGDEQ